MAAIFESMEPKKSEYINGLSILLVKRSYEPLISPLTKIVSSEHYPPTIAIALPPRSLTPRSWTPSIGKF